MCDSTVGKTRGLFEIRAVNKETDEIVYKSEVIADGEKEALFESDLKETLKSLKLNRDDVTIVVRNFGAIPAKEKAKTVKLLGQLGNIIVGKEQK